MKFIEPSFEIISDNLQIPQYHLTVKFITDSYVIQRLLQYNFQFVLPVSYDNIDANKIELIIPESIAGDDRDYLLSNEVSPWEDFDSLKGLISDFDNRYFVSNCADAVDTYNTLINRGWTSQRACSSLPNCVAKEISVTATVREWHFFCASEVKDDYNSPMRELLIPLILQLNDTNPGMWYDLVHDYKLTDYLPAYKQKE